MMESYAVLWSDAGGPVRAGKLELGSVAFHLVGESVRRIAYSQIEQLRVGRGLAERIRGRPVLVIDLVSGEALRVGSIGGPGTLLELGDRLAGLASLGAVA